MSTTDQLSYAATTGTDLDLASLQEPDFFVSIEDLANGPIAVPFFFWLCTHSNSALAISGAERLLYVSCDPAVLGEIVDVWTHGLNISDEVIRRFWATLVYRIEDRSQSYGVRATALHGAVLLSQNIPALLRKLQGALLDIDNSDDPHFLRHLAKVLGTFLSHDHNVDFRNKIETLLAIEEVEDEAAMELGLDSLRIGLESISAEDAKNAFQSACLWFSRSLDTSEERADAALYKRSVELLVDLHLDGFDGFLSEEVKELQVAAFAYGDLLSSSRYDRQGQSWLGLTIIAGVHWSMLAMRLAALDLSLKKKIWIDVARVIEDELYGVFESSRSISGVGGEGVLDDVIRPKLSKVLLVQRRHLDEIDQWIEENADSPILPVAIKMRQSVEEIRERNILHDPASVRFGWLDELFAAGNVGDSERTKLVEMLHRKPWLLGLQDNPITTAIQTKILSQITVVNRHYCDHSAARVIFAAILYFSLSFLRLRQNMTQSNDPAASYLFERNSELLPLERDLQLDYFKFLKGTDLSDCVQLEVSDVGSGRADVYFSLDGITVVVEVKRSFSNETLDESLNRYGGQAAAYQTTNATFGFLLVLDLFDRNGSQPHIEDQIGLKRIEIEGQASGHDVVVMRVQGRRKSPAKQRL